MDEHTIRSTLARHPLTKKFFKAVLARDELTSINIRKDALYIVNTDKRDQRGSHWTLIFFPSAGNAFFFDSYGLMPIYKEFRTVLQNYDYNKRQLQSAHTSVCGFYVLFFAVKLSAGYTMEEICQTYFTNIPILNDYRVVGLCKKTFSLYNTHCRGLSCHSLKKHDTGKIPLQRVSPSLSLRSISQWKDRVYQETHKF
jgi:hypothetical protein